MLIRRATPADAEAIAALHIASWQAAYRGALPDPFLDSQSLSERTADWQGRLCKGNMLVLLGEFPGQLLSFCATGPTHDHDQAPEQVWEIYNLHVTPARRGGGIGTALFTAARRLGQEAGRRELSLWVVDRNTPARRFYEKHGMWADGARQVHPVGPDAQLEEVRYRCGL